MIVLSGVMGWGLGMHNNWLPLQDDRTIAVKAPAPWRIPQYPGMGDLRLAMVNDILHERFNVRSPEWYRARNVEDQAVIAQWRQSGSPAATAPWSAWDDLAVGLDKVGQDDDAVIVMEEKARVLGLPLPLHRLPAPPPPPLTPGMNSFFLETPVQELAAWRLRDPLTSIAKSRYTTLANLGTVLIHGHLAAALAGDVSSTNAVVRGLACLDGAIAINPAAHFGRETWQIVAVEDLLASVAHPEIPLQFDLIGEPLDPDRPVLDASAGTRDLNILMLWPWEVRSAMPTTPEALLRLRSNDLLFGPDWTADYVDQHLSDEDRILIRSHIAPVGCDARWQLLVHPSRSDPCPFDEPLLGFMGLWAWGGGANPHLALTIATILESCGQSPLAIDAYERCKGLAEQFSRDPALQSHLLAYCTRREELLGRQQSPYRPAAWLTAEQSRSAAELKWALERREQDWAQEQLALEHGVRPEDIPLGDADGIPLASPTGSSDEIWQVDRFRQGDGLACMLIAMAASAWLVIAYEAKLASRSKR